MTKLSMSLIFTDKIEFSTCIRHSGILVIVQATTLTPDQSGDTVNAATGTVTLTPVQSTDNS